jgi:NDP-4-keto-2,6-dideoxyhexose 3-C-methyltransferase
MTTRVQPAVEQEALYQIRNTCRSCGSARLKSVLNLGPIQISNFVDLDAEEEEKSVPLDLLLCADCSLVQLRHTTRPDLLWKHYWYRSGTNFTMRSALAEITAKAEGVVSLSPGDIVVDIGCNDGTLLRSYRTKGIQLVGFEPAENLISDASVGTSRIINDFFNYGAFDRAPPGAKAKVITSISMFYDLEDPNAFVRDAAQCLDRDGLWIIQMNYLPSMLKINAFDNIGHEHLEYYSLLSLRRLLDRNSLEIIDVETTDLNGGSIRVYIRHPQSKLRPAAGAAERIRKIEELERKMALDTPAPYEAFTKRIERIKHDVVDFVLTETGKGKTVYAYGASTRGTTLLQYFGLDRRQILKAVERSPYKFGKKTAGTWIPIISEEQARKEKPDYLLILPYFFLDEFRQRERDYLLGGGKFIVPVPKMQIIGA